jgi:hypothetical protein
VFQATNFGANFLQFFLIKKNSHHILIFFEKGSKFEGKKKTKGLKI